MHVHNVLHHDIKLTNILVSENGTPVLCDFGVIKMHESQTVAAMPIAVTTTVQVALRPPRTQLQKNFTRAQRAAGRRVRFRDLSVAGHIR